MGYHIETTFNTDGVNYPSVSVYFHGCDKPVKCEGCHNKELWNFDNVEINEAKLYRQIKTQINKVKKYYPKIAVCFVGGEPLSHKYRTFVYFLSHMFSNDEKVITILYTWRTLENIKSDKDLTDITEDVDYGILGAFDETMLTKGFPASLNQIIYDFKNNLKITKEEIV